MQLHTAHRSPKGSTRTLQLGDIVLVEGKTHPKCIWDLARVMQVFPGEGGRIRAGTVKRTDGTVVKGLVETLYQLEIS